MNLKTKIGLIFSVVALLFLTEGCSSYKRAVRRNKQEKEFIEKEKKIISEAEKGLKGDEKKIIKEAYEWIGTPYVYGRQDKGEATDCSGFVMQVFNSAIGCKLPRNSAKQAEFCTPVSKKKLKPGDLVFFCTNNKGKINHVGIMIDEVQFIHASSSHGVMVSSMNSKYYQTHFKSYGRVPCLKH